MLLYSHDQNGMRLDGDKAALIAHIKQGGSARICFFDAAANRATTVIPMVLFTNLDDAFAQVGWILSDWMPADSPLLQFYDPPSSFTLNISTSGAAHRRIIDNMGTVAVDTIKMGIEWRMES